ncbi:MAG: hypothetical protein WAL72_14270 [Streptosporangiaceae bacterium]
MQALLGSYRGFAVASGYDETTGRYVGLAIPQEKVPPQITDSTLLVRPDRAIAQRERERAEQEAARAAAAAGAAGTGASAGTGGNTAGTGILAGGGSPAGAAARPGGPVPYSGPGPSGAADTTPAAPRHMRFYGTVRLDLERFGRDLNRLYQEVIQHLAAPEGVDLEITVEINASKKDGYPDDKARIVTENARTLKFDQYGFEDH